VKPGVAGSIPAVALTLSILAFTDLPLLAVLAGALVALLWLWWDMLWVLVGGGAVGVVRGILG